MTSSETDHTQPTAADVIVIGSGLGGLAAASLLSRLAGRRVLVLEKHFTPGGFTHSFTRHGFRWDVGLHYVGQMAPGLLPRKALDAITDGAVQWTRLPERYDRLHYPGLDVEFAAGAENWVAGLARHFPGQEQVLRRYLRDIKRAAGWLTREVIGWNLPAVLRPAVQLVNARHRGLALMTTEEYLQQHIADERLRAVLASQWGDYGLVPARSAFGTHALIVDHYLDGAWYPVGGADAVRDAAIAVIERGGGEVRVNHTVQEILIEDDRAVGVRAYVKRGSRSREQEFRAPVVISDAGLVTTFGTLLNRDPDLAGVDLSRTRQRAGQRRGAELARQARAIGSGTGCVTVYLGLRESPEQLGLDGANHWIFAGFEHTDAGTTRPNAESPEFPVTYASFSCLHDPAAPRHTMQIMGTVDAAAFADWAGSAWQKRGQDYEGFKQRLADALIDRVEAQVPGLRDLIEHVEVSTPLTVTSFQGGRSGGFTDLAGSPERLRQRLAPVRTPVPGLYLAGSEAFSVGIVGAAMGGVLAAGAVLGPLGIPRVLSAVTRGTTPMPKSPRGDESSMSPGTPDRPVRAQ